MYQLPPLAPREILIYLRKSRADDPLLSVEEVLSKHEEMLDDYCRRTFGELIPEENRFREVVSGETLDSRPQMLRVLRLIEQPQYKAILCVEPQRLSRGDLEDIGRLSKLLRYTGTLVITLQYSYDPTDQRDRDDLERELKRGNDYLEYTKRIMRNGRLLSVKRGNYIGNVAPFGYRKVSLKEDRRTVYTLEPDPAEAPYVKMIFELYASGKGACTIASELDALGAPTRRQTHWTQASIDSILRNPHYLGLVCWGRRKEVTTVKDGDLVTSRPRSDSCVVYEGKHPALISRELWDEVRQKKASLPKIQQDKELRNPLASLVYCSCGHAMTLRTYKKDGRERSVPRLLCTDQTRCHNRSCTVDYMLSTVKKALTKALRQTTVDLTAPRTSAENEAERVAQLEKRLKELEELELVYWEKYATENMPQSVFKALNEKLNADRAATAEALKKAKEAAATPAALTARRASIAAAIEALSSPAVPASKQNALLRACISRITYSCPASSTTPTTSITFNL